MVDVETLGLNVMDDTVATGQRRGEFLCCGLLGADGLLDLALSGHFAGDLSPEIQGEADRGNQSGGVHQSQGLNSVAIRRVAMRSATIKPANRTKTSLSIRAS